jgi:hypothetical protein
LTYLLSAFVFLANLLAIDLVTLTGVDLLARILGTLLFVAFANYAEVELNLNPCLSPPLPVVKHLASQSQYF